MASFLADSLSEQTLLYSPVSQTQKNADQTVLASLQSPNQTLDTFEVPHETDGTQGLSKMTVTRQE